MPNERNSRDGAAKLELMEMELLDEACECLRVMAHPLRLRIVEILMQEELPVHCIAELCNLPANQASEHLRLMAGRGLLDSHRRGHSVYYRINNPRLPSLINCIRSTCNKG